MPNDDSLRRLLDLHAVASEQGATLAFRVADERGGFEPTFMRIERIDRGAQDGGNEMALITISDIDGLSLGRYAIPRDSLDAALERAEVSLAAIS